MLGHRINERARTGTFPPPGAVGDGNGHGGRSARGRGVDGLAAGAADGQLARAVEGRVGLGARGVPEVRVDRGGRALGRLRGVRRAGPDARGGAPWGRAK